MTYQNPDAHARERAWIELSMAALEHNVSALKGLLRPGCELMAVLKADAYGHGADAIAPALDALGVRAYAVANIDEAVRLRRLGVRGEILIFGYTPPGRAATLAAMDLTQTVGSPDHARALSFRGLSAKCALEIDTGMHRSGLSWEDEAGAAEILTLPGIRVTQIYTHLSCSDSLEPEDAAWTGEQLKRFWGILDAVKRRGIPIPKIHVQSTYGLLNYPDLACDYVRVGVALYGVLSYVNRPTRVTPDLRPVLALKTVVTALRTVRAGEAVGYGRAYTAPRDAVVATLAVGYRDGVPRPLSGMGHVAIRGRLAPIVGKICMDNMTVDASAIPDVRVGDTATVIGGPLPAPLVAEQAGAFTPELFGRLSPDLPVVRLNTRSVR